MEYDQDKMDENDPHKAMMIEIRREVKVFGKFKYQWFQ